MIVGKKILFASILALSAATSAYAAEEDMLAEREATLANASVERHVTMTRAHRAAEARAYAPVAAPVVEGVDFGIGSQR